MRGRLRPLRALLHVGGLSQFAVVSRVVAREEDRDGDANGSSDSKHVPENESASTKLSRQLEAWLLPGDKAEGIGPMLKDLQSAIAKDTEISPEEGKRLPLNALMLKALNDRRRLEALAGADEHQKPPGEKNAELAASDQDAIRRAAHYCRFAAAAYGVFGNLGSMKKIVEDEADLPPPDLMMKSTDYLQKWFISKHTRIDIEDVKDVVTTGSEEMRAYFVAVDHSTQSVVLSIRGTYSLSDTMVDLLCQPVDFAGGTAHQGISESALKVWGSVKEQVEGLLKDNDDYQLILTGHSLGAGAAVLLKIILEYNKGEEPSGRSTELVEGDADDEDGKGSGGLLDAGRPVHVECYAFAPPPVFSGSDAVEKENVWSFVHGSDCVPTVSIGSMYSLFRTIRKIDELPLDIYQRAGFILDARVRLQQCEEGLNNSTANEDRNTVASKILDLGTQASAELFPDDDSESDVSAKRDVDKISDRVADAAAEATTAKSPPDKEARSTDTDDILSDVKSAISSVEGGITRFTRDVSEAAEGLMGVVGKVGETAEHLLDGVSGLSDSVRKMSSDELALTALLVKRLAAGGGPNADEVLAMVEKCIEEATPPDVKGSIHPERTIGDLVIPGKIFWLEHNDGGAEGANNEEGGEEDSSRAITTTVRRTNAEELGGIVLSNSMVDDHSMDVYEPAVIDAARRYSRKQ